MICGNMNPSVANVVGCVQHDRLVSVGVPHTGHSSFSVSSSCVESNENTFIFHFDLSLGKTTRRI